MIGVRWGRHTRRGGKAERPADTTISSFYAGMVIRYLLGCDNDKLPREVMLALE